MDCEIPGNAGIPSSFVPTGIIYGIVTRQNRPASHPSVKLTLYAFPHGRFGPPSSVTERETCTDSEGLFQFDQLPLLEFGPLWKCYLLSAEKGDYRSIRRIFLSGNRPAWEEHLALYPSGGISGTVVAPSGVPCVGAAVYAVPVPMDDGPEFGPFACLPAIADANGQFELASLFPGQWLIEVRADGYERLLSEPFETGSREVHLTLRHGASISGRVLHHDSSEPVANIAVELNDKNGRVVLPPSASDAYGNFRFRGVPDGTYTLYINGDEYVRADACSFITVTDGTDLSDISIPVERGAVVTGTVRRLDSGCAVAGLEVVAVRGDHFRRGPRPRTQTNESGAFRLAGLPGGSYQIMARSNSELLGTRISLDLAPGALITGLSFALNPSPTISGVVTDREGVSQAGVHLFFVIGDDDTRSVVTDWTGRFQVPGGPESKRLRVDVRHCPWRLVSDPILNEQSALRNTLHLIVERGAVVAGTVVSELGELVDDANVRLSHTTDEECYFDASTELGGEFSFWGVPEGTYELDAWLGYDATRIEVGGIFLDVAPGGTHTGLKLVLRNPEPDPRLRFTISGRVVNTNGTPIADAEVEAFAYDSDSRSRGTTDEDGGFTLEDLSEEEHQLSAIAANHLGSRWVKVPGGATDVVLVLDRYAKLRGKVISGTTGAPVRPFSMACASEQEVVHILKRYPVMVDSCNGEFDVEVYPDTRFLYVQAGGFAAEVLDLGTITEGEVREEIIVQLKPEAQVRGTVVDEKGQPILGVGIYFEALAEYRKCLAMTDLDGSFQLRSVGPWLSEIFVSHPDYQETRIDCVCVPGETTSLQVVLRRNTE